jgi:ubiquinol-cytochrome c reductase cytochrome b subunit
VRRPTAEDPVRFVDERLGQAPMLKKALRYTFPDHWSFLLGEVALYSFVFLIASGTFLALFFEPSLKTTVYEGSYAPLVGREMSQAYASVLGLSFEIKVGLLMRQAHHWAADVFIAAIIIHLMRVFFTGAFRKPRDLTYYVGLTMLGIALLEGFLGYSLVDDLLSGMGLAIAYGVVLSIPVIGGNLGLGIWGGEYPGTSEFMSRMYIGHVFLLPVLIGTLIAVHLLLVTLSHHGQFRGPRRTEANVVGTPLWPAYALRSIGLMLATCSALLAMGALVQINPIWEWGPFETYLSTNGAQPDWYLGWLIGALRMMPSIEPNIGDYTLAGNAFFGGALFPTLVFAFLFAYPSIDRRMKGQGGYHHLLERPRDNPTRTGIGWALIALVATVLFAGAVDRVSVQTGISYIGQLWVFRVLFFVAPVVAFFVARMVCRELLRAEQHPVEGTEGSPRAVRPDRPEPVPPGFTGVGPG